MSRTQTLRLASISVGLLVIATASYIFWDASRALRHSAQRVSSEAEIAFASTAVERPALPKPEWISAPLAFSDARVFQGNLYLCGPAGLFKYDSKGTLLEQYRPGLELPSVPLRSLAIGQSAGVNESELFVTTSGEGLLTFNGRSFRHLRPEQAPYRKLTAALPLHTGRVLLGTEQKGVLLYDGKRITRFHPALSDMHVTALEGDDSAVWIGTLDRGLLLWRAGQVSRIGEPGALPDPQILSLAQAGETVFAGTPMGVAEFQGGRFVRNLDSGFFARSLLVRNDTLFAGTLEEGLIQVPLVSQAARAPRPRGEPLPGSVERLFEVDGAVLALTEEGLYAVDERGGEWRQILAHDRSLLTDRNISALAVDGAGRVWVGYFDRGLDILEADGRRAAHYENENLFCINRIVWSQDRNMAAVATANGLVLFDSGGKPRQVLGRPEGLIANHITDVSLEPDGMTVATPAGLTLIDATEMRSLYAFQGLVNNHAYALARSGDRLLVGTLGGLSVLEGGIVRASYTTENSALRHNWITAIAPTGKEWFVGTYGGGIFRLDDSGRWHTFPDLASSFEVNPNAMAVTERHVCAGTLGKGLYVFDRGAERWTGVSAGLPSLNVTALAARDGYLYVGTDNGLVRIPESSLVPF